VRGRKEKLGDRCCALVVGNVFGEKMQFFRKMGKLFTGEKRFQLAGSFA